MILEASFPPDTRVENEARALVAAGHAVHIFCLSFGAEKSAEQLGHNIYVYRMHLNPTLFNKIRATVIRFPFYNSMWLRFLRRAASKVNLDAIHVHDLPLAKVGSIAAKGRAIPFILDFHENYPAALEIWGHTRKLFGNYFFRVEDWQKFEFEYVHKADRVIVVVDEAVERFHSVGIQDSKFVVLSNTLNLENFKDVQKEAVSTSTLRFKIVYIGGFGPHRGLRTAIEAMPEILTTIPETQLILVGEGSDRSHLQRCVAELGLEDSISFPGWVPLEDVPQIIAEADVGIVPHISSAHTETTVPHKLFQYMYLGKPVVVSDCKPLQRLVKGVNAGLVFRAGDSPDFARQILRLRDAALRHELGEKGHLAVLAKYNWKYESQKLIRIYQEFVN